MTYYFRDNDVGILGDTHSLNILYNTMRRVPKGTDVFSVGDNGIGFGKKEYAIISTLKSLNMINEMLEENDVNLYLNIGNHDATYPEIWDEKFSNIFMVKSGDYAIFPNGKKALLVGGGISIDRIDRKRDYSYWIMEHTPYLTNIEKCDYVLSHDCPEEFNHSTWSLENKYPRYVMTDVDLIYDCEKQRENMGRIVKESGATEIYYGHMHNNMEQIVNGVYGRCIDIDELYHLDATKNKLDND